MDDQPLSGGNRSHDADRPAVCEIRIGGHLGEQWSDWFAGLAIQPQTDGHTLLSGVVVDQAALHGILKKVRDLGMPLLSVNFVEEESREPFDPGRLSHPPS